MKCLFCLSTVDEVDTGQTNISYYTLFPIFTKYIHLQFDENDLSDSKIPLCPKCQTEMQNVEKLADQIDELVRIIKKAFATSCKTVIESENRVFNETEETGPKEGDDDVTSLDDQFHSIRKSIIQNFDAKISLADMTRNLRVRPRKKKDDWYNYDFTFDDVLDALHDDDDASVSLDYGTDSAFDDNVVEDPDFEFKTKKKQLQKNIMIGQLKEKLQSNNNKLSRPRTSKRCQHRETDSKSNSTPRVIQDLGDGIFEYLGCKFKQLNPGYQCSSCDYVSASSIRQNILFHIKAKHRENVKYSCNFPECGKAFMSRKHLRRHQEVHNDKRSHMCELCGRFCKTKKSLQDHKARHEGKFVQECHLCKKKVSNKTVLQLHIKTVHEGVKEFQCHLCALKVSTSQSLKRHMLTHEPKKEKPMTFDVPNKPFACEICDSRFPAKTNLNYHMQTVHAKEKNFQCSVCGHKFAKMKLLRRHAFSHSEDRNEICPTCGKLFKNLVYLKNHIKRHELVDKAFECDICHVKLRTKASLVFHISTVHEKQRKFPCKLCNKKFFTSHALKRHGGTHTTERPHACDQCGGKFQQFCTLKRHIMEVHEKIPPKNPRRTPLQRRILKEEKLKREMEYQLRLNNGTNVVESSAIHTENVSVPLEVDNTWTPLTDSNILVVDTVNVSDLKSNTTWATVETNSVPTAITVIHTPAQGQFATSQKYLIPTNPCNSTGFAEFPDPNYFTQEIRDCRNYLRDSS